LNGYFGLNGSRYINCCRGSTVCHIDFLQYNSFWWP